RVAWNLGAGIRATRRSKNTIIHGWNVGDAYYNHSTQYNFLATDLCLEVPLFASGTLSPGTILKGSVSGQRIKFALAIPLVCFFAFPL
ncbi:MAG: hypothetical protein ACO3A4_04245, partial [Silvanigrellaceae bacterium]